jgi:hypothetical protein
MRAIAERDAQRDVARAKGGIGLPLMRSLFLRLVVQQQFVQQVAGLHVTLFSMEGSVTQNLGN